jgi:hypothetical protein
MMRPLSLVLALLVVAAVPASAGAKARSIDDCEKIEAADAYNNCLASFGPTPRSHGRAAYAPADPEATVPKNERGRRAGSGTAGRRRVHTEFTPAAGKNRRQRMEFVVTPTQ